jgi:hypothetical protein
LFSRFANDFSRVAPDYPFGGRIDIDYAVLQVQDGDSIAHFFDDPVTCNGYEIKQMIAADIYGQQQGADREGDGGQVKSRQVKTEFVDEAGGNLNKETEEDQTHLQPVSSFRFSIGENQADNSEQDGEILISGNEVKPHSMVILQKIIAGRAGRETAPYLK